MKRIVTLLIGIMLFLSTPILAENQKSLRELLVNSPNTVGIIAIDDYYTFVMPKIPAIGIGSGEIPKEFTNELYSACDTQFETKEGKPDPLTGKNVETWVPFNGKPYEIYLTEKGTRRCKDRFEIVQVWGSHRSSFSGSIDMGFSPKSFILKHASPQPYIYKSAKVPAIDEVTMLSDGDIKTLGKQPENKKSGGFFSKLLSFDKSPDSDDLFQYTNALCKKNNGKTRFVIKGRRFIEDPNGNIEFIEKGAKGKGRYIYETLETDAFNAFKYVWIGGYRNNGVPKDWYLACEGSQPFVVRETEKISNSSRGDINTELTAVFVANRGLEGIDFKPMPESQVISNPITPGVAPQSSLELFAIEVLNKKSNHIKTVGVEEYSGTYNGKDSEGCDLVAVEKKWDVNVKKPRIDTYNYKICNGAIAKASETGIESIPVELNNFMQKIARMAQQRGTAEGEYEEYNVKAIALRDKDQCSVEVKVLKGINLISTKTLNGCQ